MKVPLWVSLLVGSLGAASAYMAAHDPAHSVLWSAVAGGAASLVPLFHKAVT